MYVKWFIEWISSDEFVIYMESLNFLICDFVGLTPFIILIL